MTTSQTGLVYRSLQKIRTFLDPINSGAIKNDIRKLFTGQQYI